MARAPAGTDCNQRQGLYLLRVREAVSSNRRLQTPQYPVTIRDKFEFLTPLLQPPLGSDERLSWEVRENQMSQCKVGRPHEGLRQTCQNASRKCDPMYPMFVGASCDVST